MAENTQSTLNSIASKLAPKHSPTGAIHWGLQRITGFLLIFLVGAHMLVEHFIDTDTGPASFQSVTDRLENPLYFLMDVLLLVIALYHGLNGVRTVLLDLNPPPKLLSLMNILLVILGLIAAGYGIWLLQEIS
ncbi:MAG: hypothetical protein ACE5OZ_07795 [Candidatus Heimdallarchaeota archaeon]